MIRMKRHLDFHMDGGRVWTPVQFLTSENTIFISFYTAFNFFLHTYGISLCGHRISKFWSYRYLNPFPDLLDII